MKWIEKIRSLDLKYDPGEIRGFLLRTYGITKKYK
jgi:hypothetical protein